MYFLLNMSMFQSAMLVYQRVVEMGFCNHIDSCCNSSTVLWKAFKFSLLHKHQAGGDIISKYIIWLRWLSIIFQHCRVFCQNMLLKHHAHPWQRPRSFERKRPGSQAEKAGVRVGDEVLQVRSEICRKPFLDAVKKVDPGNVLNCIFRGWHTTQLL